MLDFYTNQSVVWKPVTSVDKYNQPTYGTAQTIAGRRETKIKLIRDAQGTEVVSTTQVFTETAVNVGDLLDNVGIIMIEDAVNLEGAVIFKKAYLQ